MKSGLLIIIFLSLYSCTHSNVDQQLRHAEELMNEYPDSALTILLKINRYEIGNSDKFPHYALALSQAYDKNYVDIDSDSLIKPAVDYFLKNGSDHERAIALFYMGRIHVNAKHINLGMHNFLKASSFAESAGSFHVLGLIHNNIGLLYYSQYQIKEAKIYYDKALKAFGQIDDYKNIANTQYNYAKCCLSEKDYKEAIKNFEQARDYFYSANMHDRYLDASSPIAYAYSALGESHEAMMELHSTIKRYKTSATAKRIYPILSSLYLKNNQVDSALYYANAYYNSLDSTDWRGKASSSILLKQIEEFRHNYRKASEHSWHYADAIAEMWRLEKEKSITELEKKYRTKELQDKYIHLRVKSRYQIIIASIIILGLSIVVALFYIIRKRSLEKKTREMEEYSVFVESLKDNNDKLSTMHDNLSRLVSKRDNENNNLLSLLENRLNQIRELWHMAHIYQNKPDKFLSKFKDQINIINTNNSLNELHHIVDHRSYGVITYLKEQYPNLNDEDLDLCCMLCLGYNAKEIGLFYGYSNMDTIYTKRYRLRKKIGSVSSSNLEKFIKDLVYKLELQHNAQNNNTV